MFEKKLFTVFAIDGEAADLCNYDMDSLRFNNLSWDDAMELAHLSFVQGFQLVIWMEETEQEA